MATGFSTMNRRRHSKAVRSCTPTNLATIPVATPSAISKSAWARRAIRASAFGRRAAASISNRCSGDTSSGTVAGPRCPSPTHGDESIMKRLLRHLENRGQIFGARH
jgi:hypothetical protein